MISVKCSNVDLIFPIYSNKDRSLKNNIINSLSPGGFLKKNKRGHILVHALKNINFDLYEGDKLGIVGPNGSGKTSLLRALNGIYPPTNGSISVSGRVGSLIDISTGIDEELSGIENLNFRGLLMGLSRGEIESKIDEIINFSGLGDFINLPVKTYSSGMKLRLSFAISTSINPEILILDEWLSVGDKDFSMASEERLLELLKNTNILIMASHSIDLIKRICNKVLVLNKGHIDFFGPIESARENYF